MCVERGTKLFEEECIVLSVCLRSVYSATTHWILPVQVDTVKVVLIFLNVKKEHWLWNLVDDRENGRDETNPAIGIGGNIGEVLTVLPSTNREHSANVPESVANRLELLQPITEGI